MPLLRKADETGKALGLKFVKVGSKSWACIGGGDDVFHSYGSNQGFAIGENLGLIIDSGFHNGTAKQVLRKAGREGAKRLLIVDTHYHSDHVFGNSVLASKWGVVIAQENCRRSMLGSSRRLLAGYVARGRGLGRLLKGVDISYPSVTYQNRLRIHLDEDMPVDLIHPGSRAHTDGDSMVLVQKDHVLFAGDILWVGYHPNLEDADIRGQINALRMILRLKPRKIIPGHGPISGPREVKLLIRYLEEFERNSRIALKEGLSGDQLVRRVIPSWSWDWKMRWLAESYVRGLGKSRRQN